MFKLIFFVSVDIIYEYFYFRPVLAIIDIETLVIDEERREKVYQSVIDQQGPPDGTVVVAVADGDDFDDDVIDQILTTLGEIGEIILVRYHS